MKQVFTCLLLMMPVFLFAQKKKKKQKLTDEQIAANYLHDIQLQKGFDTIYVTNCGLAGKEDGYPEMSKEFNVNVTKNAGSSEKFDSYCASIKDTLIAISHRYFELLLNTNSRQFQYQLECGKYVKTKSIFALEYGHKENEKKGSYFTDNIYAPGRPW